MFILNGQPLNPDLPFEHDGIQYPSNFLRLATPEERQTIGITEVPDYPRPDDRFYWVTQNLDGTYTAVAKDIESIKSMLMATVKATAYSMLAPTDYKFIRTAETGQAVDAATIAKRTAIRSACSSNEAAITNAASVDELALLQFTWPSES